jgi:ankyrin repeat protein
MTPNPSNPYLKPTLIMLFDYCIRNQSITLFLRFHHRYHNLFDINTPDIYNHNDTLLIKATKENSIGIIKYLLEKGADPNLRNEFGNTPMHYAISFKYFNIVDILKKNGAREDIENFKGLIPWECVNETCD